MNVCKRMEADVVVLGSGVAGLTAALTASLSGLRTIVIEHQPDVGGTSARSPGAAWLGVRLAVRYLRDRLQHQRGTRLVLGNALVARLFKAVLTANSCGGANWQSM